jgi:hypothetical protein
MGRFTVAASELLSQVVYPPFVSVWNGLRNLTGRQGRLQRTADDKAAASERRRHKNLWKHSHDR